MPIYDYYCEANNKTIEVIHSSKIRLNTWGEICTHLAQDPGELAVDTKIKLLLNGRIFVTGNLTDLSKGKVSDKTPIKHNCMGCCPK